MLDDICRTCGHTRRHHIYYESACRPGFVCEAGCAEFVGEKSVMYYVEQSHRQQGAAEERDQIVSYMERHGGRPAGLLAQDVRKGRHHD